MENHIEKFIDILDVSAEKKAILSSMLKEGKTKEVVQALEDQVIEEGNFLRMQFPEEEKELAKINQETDLEIEKAVLEYENKMNELELEGAEIYKKAMANMDNASMEEVRGEITNS